ncbi:hypothetical protein TrRE_jg8517, partial [Triparma retinervis]
MREKLYDVIGEVGFKFWRGTLGAALWDYFSWKVEEFEVGEGLFKQIERRKRLIFRPSRSNCTVLGSVVSLGALPSLLRSCLRLGEGSEMDRVVEAVRTYVNRGEEGGKIRAIPRPNGEGEGVKKDRETYLSVLVSHYSSSSISSPAVYVKLFGMGMKMSDCKSFKLAVKGHEGGRWREMWGSDWKAWTGMVAAENKGGEGGKEYWRLYGSEE